MTKVKFTHDWGAIDVDFDKKIEVKEASITTETFSRELCEHVILEEDLLRLGVDATCKIGGEAGKTFTIRIGNNASIMSANLLTLKPGAVYNPGCDTALELTRREVSGAPLITPQVNLVGVPKAIGLCMEVNIAVQNKSLVGRRPLKSLTWTISSLTGAPQNNMGDYQLLIDKGLNNDNHSLLLPPLSFPFGVDITITVSYSNFLDQTNSTLLLLKTVKLPLPSVKIEGPQERNIYTSSATTISCSTEMPKCSQIQDMSMYVSYTVKTLIYKWKQSGGSHIITSADFFKQHANKYYMVIPPYSLKPASTYELQVTAYITNHSDTQQYAKIILNTMTSPPIAFISGGNRVGSVERDLVLNGSLSTNLDVEDSEKKLKYSWRCTDNLGELCKLSNGDLIDYPDSSFSTLTIKAKTLLYGNYTFSLTVTKDDSSNRKASGLTPLIQFEGSKKYSTETRLLTFRSECGRRCLTQLATSGISQMITTGPSKPKIQTQVSTVRRSS